MTIREALREAYEKRSGYAPFIVVRSAAHTVDGVNRAICKTTGNDEAWFEDEASMQESINHGFLSMCSDGFIIWADEDDRWYCRYRSFKDLMENFPS